MTDHNDFTSFNTIKYFRHCMDVFLIPILVTFLVRLTKIGRKILDCSNMAILIPSKLLITSWGFTKKH